MTVNDTAKCGNCEDIDPATCFVCSSTQPVQPLDLAPIQARNKRVTNPPGGVILIGEVLAHARQDVPALIAEVLRLRAELATARAAAFREAARLLEDTGRDDDAVNLLDNVAEGIEVHAPA